MSGVNERLVAAPAKGRVRTIGATLTLPPLRTVTTIPDRLGRLLAVCLLSLSCASAPADRIDDAALGDETRSADWLAFGRTYSEQRFSPLAQIDTATVAGLKVDWYLDLPDTRGLVSTPLVADGVLYFIGSMNVVRAVDAATGKLLWSYDPRVADRAARRMQVGWEHSRGIALWNDKVILATWDGRLIAVRAEDGGEVWSTQTIDTKINAISAHKSQVPKLDIESSRDLARAMGRISGYSYAEAYEVLRVRI